MRIVNQRTEMVPVGALKPHPKNPNQGDVGLIGESISHNGFYGSLVVQQSTGHILRGNHTWQAARQAGATEIPVTYVDVDDETALRILLVDNRATREGIDDSNALAALLQELAATPAGLEGSGWDGDALDELLADLGQTGPELAGDPDAAPEVHDDQEPLTTRGDIIRLGRHTLGCIDSTNLEEVRRLLCGVTPDMVWTDPPYGINVVKPDGHIGTAGPKWGVRKNAAGAVIRAVSYPPMAGDQSTETAKRGYGVAAAIGVPVLVFWGANHYASALPDSAGWIVWDKQTSDNNFADAELAWTNQDRAVRLVTHLWNGMARATEVGEPRIAPTQKPVALAEWCFAQYGKEGDFVLDLFVGSGTSIIACERTGRACYGAELSPHYVDAAVKRWEHFTGQQAVRGENILAACGTAGTGR